MAFLLELLPFPLTFDILFRYGGFDALESVCRHHDDDDHGRNHCWEFLKLMDFSRRAELLCICRTVQLLDHPAHALFLLNYPPDSSIPENIRAWRVAQRCCIGWSPNVQSVVLAMRAFVELHQRQVFPWLDTAELACRRSEAEWKAVGRQQALNYRFTEWWWHGQREAFHLERAAAKSSMGIVIRETAKAEMERLLGALKRRQLIAMREDKARSARKRMRRAEEEVKLRENNRGGGKRQKTATEGVVKMSKVKKEGEEDTTKPTNTTTPAPPAIVLTSEDKKKATALAKAQHDRLVQSVLPSVKQTLNNVSPGVLEARIRKVARHIVALGEQHPLVKWNIRLLFHLAAEEAGQNVWAMEFLLHKCEWSGGGGSGGLEGLGKLLCGR